FPPANSSVTTADVPVRGTAGDNLAVSQVRVYLNTNAPITATGTANWSLTMTDVPPGTNTLVAEAIDTTGNRSQVIRKFFHSVRAPLSLQIMGGGVVTGQTNGAMLEVGRPYKIVAAPLPGYLFAGWLGTDGQMPATMSFIMESNLTFTALFVT